MSIDEDAEYYALMAEADWAKPADPAPAGPVQTHAEDKCCGKLIEKAMRSGHLAAADRWLCPRCGEEWRPEMVGPVRHWTMRPAVFVFRPGGR